LILTGKAESSGRWAVASCGWPVASKIPSKPRTGLLSRADVRFAVLWLLFVAHHFFMFG
jgi:hypothetical protein